MNSGPEYHSRCSHVLRAITCNWVQHQHWQLWTLYGLWIRGRNIVVAVATFYRLDRSSFQARWGKDILSSMPRPVQLSVECVPGVFYRRVKGRGCEVKKERNYASSRPAFHHGLNMTACYRLTEISRKGSHCLRMRCIAGLLWIPWWTVGFHSRRRVPVVTYNGCTVFLRHSISFKRGARGAKMQLIVSLPVTYLQRCMQGRCYPKRIWSVMTCWWSNRSIQGPILIPLNVRIILKNV